MLIIIDMQPDFGASSNERTQKNVCREIRTARKRNEPVLVVEYKGCGDSLPRVKRTAKKAQASFIKKDADDGSEHILKWAKKQNMPLWDLRICGVNTDACVAKTTTGLSKKLLSSRIVVVADACNSYDCKNHGYGALPSRENVRVVRKQKDN